MSRARAGVRRGAARALPPGSPGRGYALVALDTYREGRNALRRLADSVAVMHDDGRRAPDLATWQARTSRIIREVSRARTTPFSSCRVRASSSSRARAEEDSALSAASSSSGGRPWRCEAARRWDVWAVSSARWARCCSC